MALASQVGSPCGANLERIAEASLPGDSACLRSFLCPARTSRPPIRFVAARIGRAVGRSGAIRVVRSIRGNVGAGRSWIRILILWILRTGTDWRVIRRIVRPAGIIVRILCIRVFRLRSLHAPRRIWAGRSRTSFAPLETISRGACDFSVLRLTRWRGFCRTRLEHH
jgi:hypothetical protein